MGAPKPQSFEPPQLSAQPPLKQTASRRHRSLNLPTIVVGLMFVFFIHTEKVWVLLKGGSGIDVWLLLKLTPGECVACVVLNGALAGIAMAAVCPQRLVLHILVTLLLGNWGNILMHLSIIAMVPDSISVILAELCWLAGALGAGLAVQSKITRPFRRVAFTGVGDAWEPQPQRRLAVFFSVCLVIALAPQLAFLWRLGGGVTGLMMDAQSALHEIPNGHPNLNSAEADIIGFFSLYGSVIFGASIFWALITSAAFLGLTRRCFPTSAAALLTQGNPSVVWLRPFEVDGLPEGLSRKTDLILGNWKTLLGITLEQKISRCFRRFARLVAIGRPGEKLPQAGAARLFVDHSYWQALVQALMHHSDCVMLHAASSEGTLWEWSTAITELPRTRILLCVPVTGPSWRKRKKAYDELRFHIEQATGVLLPEQADKRAVFAFFETDSSPRAMWITRRTRAHRSHPLAQPLDRLRRVRIPLIKHTLVSFVLRIIYLLMLVIVCFVIMLVVTGLLARAV